jgi:hypothetical protein
MVNRTLPIAFAMAALMAWSAQIGPAIAAPAVAVEGTQFRLLSPDGTTVPQGALPGTVLTLGDGSGAQRRIRIDAVERDPSDPAGEVTLYALSIEDPVSGEWRNACLPDREGRRLGFPLAGHFTAEGDYEPAPGRLLITCTAGADGKCVRFGYKPWAKAPDGTALLPYYQACVRLVRADYAGDGRGTTRNGQPVDIYDRLGVQAPANDPAYEFEAGFGPAGAVCVRHVRVKENATLAGIEASAPRLAGRMGEICTEAFARTAGALLFVRSPP